jgi:tRNA pseudouridine38-40 synthase
MMVDAAMGYAQGKSTLSDLKAQIACKKRYTTKLAPPQGLYLAKILY